MIEKRKKNNSPPPFMVETINSDSLKERENPPLSSHSHGFLSIVKIKPNGESFSEIELKKKENLRCFKNELSSPRKMEHKEWAIEKLKKKKIKIEEAMNSCSGMKSFLRAMGIPLEKKFWSFYYILWINFFIVAICIYLPLLSFCFVSIGQTRYGIYVIFFKFFQWRISSRSQWNFAWACRCYFIGHSGIKPNEQSNQLHVGS